MYLVKETVFEGDKEIHKSEQKWNLKSQFLNQFKKLAGVSSWSVYELQKQNKTTIEKDGLRRVIEIEPKIILSVVKDEK